MTTIRLQVYRQVSHWCACIVLTIAVMFTSSSGMQAKAGDTAVVQLAADLLYAVKTGAPAGALTTALQQLSMHRLQQALPGDAHKKAFWINIYNAYTQLLLAGNSAAFDNRNRFFTARQISIAGSTFSLDDIEHGILRRSQWKWGMGYISTLFPGKLQKQLRVDTPDYRIHFALNCGAKSCPPIAFYTPEQIDTQLDLATRSMLAAACLYHEDINTVEVPALLSWYRGDFGGVNKLPALLSTYGIIPAGTRPNILYSKYDWTLYTGNFSTP